MFRITQDSSAGSIDSYLIKTTRNGSTVLVVRAHTTGPEYTAKHPHTTSTVEPLRVVLIKYESILPIDGSCVIRNMLE
jgi:hypothetical protein